MMNWLKGVLNKEAEDAFDWEAGASLVTNGDQKQWLTNLATIMADAHQTAVNKGFWEEDRPDTDAVALMHSELSEALEYWRKGNQPDDKITFLDGASVELADTLIRVFDTCGKRGYELIDALSDVIAFFDDDIDGDWVTGFSQFGLFCFDPDIIAEATSFATDVAAAHRLLSDIYDATLDSSDNAHMGTLYANLFCFIAAMSKKHNLKVATAVTEKMAYNKTRPHKHGKLF